MQSRVIELFFKKWCFCILVNFIHIYNEIWSYHFHPATPSISHIPSPNTSPSQAFFLLSFSFLTPLPLLLLPPPSFSSSPNPLDQLLCLYVPGWNSLLPSQLCGSLENYAVSLVVGFIQLGDNCLPHYTSFPISSNNGIHSTQEQYSCGLGRPRSTSFCSLLSYSTKDLDV